MLILPLKKNLKLLILHPLMRMKLLMSISTHRLKPVSHTTEIQREVDLIENAQSVHSQQDDEPPAMKPSDVRLAHEWIASSIDEDEDDLIGIVNWWC
jgi:hypothetical protein